MTKEECLRILQLLSALESWSFCSQTRLPDYLFEDITAMVERLKQEILK